MACLSLGCVTALHPLNVTETKTAPIDFFPKVFHLLFTRFLVVGRIPWKFDPARRRWDARRRRFPCISQPWFSWRTPASQKKVIEDDISLSRTVYSIRKSDQNFRGGRKLLWSRRLYNHFNAAEWSSLCQPAPLIPSRRASFHYKYRPRQRVFGIILFGVQPF